MNVIGMHCTQYFFGRWGKLLLKEDSELHLTHFMEGKKDGAALERGPQLMRGWPWESLLAVARHKDTAEMCSTDIAERERVLGGLATEAPFLLLYFASAWEPPSGREDLTAGANTRQILFALAFGIAVREGQRDHQTPNLAYTDDLTVWEGKPVGLSKSWDSLTTALSKV